MTKKKIRFLVPWEDETPRQLIDDPKVLAEIVQNWARDMIQDGEPNQEFLILTVSMTDEDADAVPDL